MEHDDVWNGLPERIDQLKRHALKLLRTPVGKHQTISLAFRPVEQALRAHGRRHLLERQRHILSPRGEEREQVGEALGLDLLFEANWHKGIR